VGTFSPDLVNSAENVGSFDALLDIFKNIL
jgi:hypothetical protein